jgi:hypothetical protein
MFYFYLKYALSAAAQAHGLITRLIKVMAHSTIKAGIELDGPKLAELAATPKIKTGT